MAAWSWGLNPGTQLDSTPAPPGPVLAQEEGRPLDPAVGDVPSTGLNHSQRMDRFAEVR